MILEIGTKAPAFTLQDQAGEKHSLKDYKGKWLLIYFYPKDDTPGCTKEACMIRDDWSKFGDLNAAVVGISKDSVESHEKFAAKYNLPFPVLSDPTGKMIEKYGAWQLKINFGKKYYGIKRMSYLIDPNGKVAKVFKAVKPAEHSAQVLRNLEKLQAE